MPVKKKILFLITKSNWGGAQRYVYDLATELPKDEFEVVVALGGNGPLATKLQTSSVRIIPIPSLQRDLSIAKEIRSFWEIWNILRAEQPNILHINSSKAGILGTLTGRLVGVPKIIFTAHGWAFNEDRPLWQRVILKTFHWLTVLFSHETIAVSKEVMRQMDWPWAKDKIIVIHNGRSITNLKSKEQARLFLSEKEPNLLPYLNDFWSMTIAELHPVKRHDAVIEAMKELVEHEPNLRHLIIGAGEQETVLREKIHDLGLEGNVFLLGAVDEAAQYLKAADLFILASRSEAMAYVIIEALIAGLPIVATRVGGIPEVVEDNINGLLTPPLDNKALFKAILSVRQDRDLQEHLSAGALKRAAEFSFDKTLAKTLNLYNS